MLGRKCVIPSVVLLLALAGCRTEVPNAPDAEFAKGAKGKPSADELTLLEYWVEPLEDGTSRIHVLAEGSATTVGGWVAHDYFFNGIADDDFNPLHYEYRHFGGVGRVDAEDLGDGTIHADIIWTGTRSLSDGQYFTDQVVTDVDGLGADPFVFDIIFQNPGDGEPGPGNTVSLGKMIEPQGVVEDGDVVGIEGVNVVSRVHDAVVDVSSFAVFHGEAAPGDVWVQELSLSEASCQKRSRKGDTVTRVTANVHAKLASDVDPAPSAWLEFHFAVGDEIAEGRSADTSDGIADVVLVREFSGQHASLDLSVWLDYVVPTREAKDLVYNPERNSNAGFDTNWTAVSAPTVDGDPPAVAFTTPITVDCR